MDAILQLPLEFRLIGLFVLGACAGSAVNWAIYRLRFEPRCVGPWSPWPPPEPLPGAPRGPYPPRQASDRLPIVGWLGLAREAPWHGRGYWLRPLLIELLSGALWAVLYAWEIDQLGLAPLLAQSPAVRDLLPWGALHAQWLLHAVLACLMLAITFIDIDEQTVPDGLTVPGALLGLAVAAAFPAALLPIGAELRLDPAPRFVLHTLDLASPLEWPAALDGGVGLAIGLASWWAWLTAIRLGGYLNYARLAARRKRRGKGSARIWSEARQRFVRDRYLWFGVAGTPVVIGLCAAGGPCWRGLLSALVGLAVGGGFIWLVRLIGFLVLRKEAMGFGDVTLMAMLGAVLGWQATLVVFFLAPACGALVGVAQLLFRREQVIPYGPFLCLAALFCVLCWHSVWAVAGPVFGLGWVLYAVLGLCLVLLGALLAFVHAARNFLSRLGGR